MKYRFINADNIDTGQSQVSDEASKGFIMYPVKYRVIVLSCQVQGYRISISSANPSSSICTNKTSIITSAWSSSPRSITLSVSSYLQPPFVFVF